ncbi:MULTISPECIES: hypothetical protein [Paenibacillus]|uniref:hypothetical protein n=1 Tax=Paenibacillus TaxID=44249 RepID=UPI00048DC853|nr:MULTISPECIES: hypothetical protein [Paenibacillus]ALA44549.1 hypothetical protein ABE82_25010 [Paenibacillus peoriae]OMF73838.1 hypothetical protein BK143_08195 [Paenibacillus peoriae]POR29163.1 hypothetical protein CG775_06265 [Paenibacillus polymyxa]SFR16299.1 hypothetical protein SAMN04488603_104199 [Paenibacillus sp. cl130]
MKSDKTKELIGNLVSKPCGISIIRITALGAATKQKNYIVDSSQTAFETNLTIREFTRKTFLSDLENEFEKPPVISRGLNLLTDHFLTSHVSVPFRCLAVKLFFS